MLRAFPAATGVVPFAGREQARTFGRLVALVMAVLLSAGLTSVATLLLVKIEARTEEFALRRALGATRARLVRLVSVEALVLAVVAVAVAVPIGQLFLLWVNQFELPFGIALRTLDLRVGYGSVLFGLAGGASVAVLIALAASVGGTMTHLVTLRPSAPKPRYRNRRLIVGAIAGLTVLALGGTGLFVRSLLAATSFEAGYLPDGLVTAQFDLRPYGYDGARSAIFMNRLMDHARGRLGALQVSTAVYAGGIGSHGDLYLDGQPVRSPGNVRYVAVDATYFATLGMPVRGRDFGRADARGTPLVSILSRSLARHLAAAEPEESVLGRELRFSFGRVRIVGIVPDVLRGVQDQRSFTLYLAYEQHAHRLGWIRQLVVRSTHTEQAKRDILRAIASVDSRVVPTSLTADNEQFESQLGIQRLAVGVLGGLSIVLLALTVVAVYVAVSTTLMARRREFAIRWALGAGRGSVVWTVTGEILVTVAGGALAGMVLLWLGSQVIGSLLIGVSAGDPLTLITTAGFVLAVALLAAGVPVAWVSRREPWAALKES
jgi:ABC-type lipoprotein release transport system permease subunit